MIQSILLVMLGFFAAGLIAVLLAPSFWKRAVRLTTRRIESTMPMSLADIEADKDQLRATYAVRIRRLESGLTAAREKSAGQLVEISRLQMVIAGLQEQIAGLETRLEERRNAANVFEKTIRRRFPELEDALAAAKAALAERAYEIADLGARLRRRDEALALIQRASGVQQAEILKLREALKRGGAERSERFKLRPSQWQLDDYRAEYDRLNSELSRLREQLAQSYDRETRQVAALKVELQQLAEQLLAASVPAPAAPQEAQPTAPSPARAGRARPSAPPTPWPRDDGKRPPAARDRGGVSRLTQPVAGAEGEVKPANGPSQGAEQESVAETASAAEESAAEPGGAEEPKTTLLGRLRTIHDRLPG